MKTFGENRRANFDYDIKYTFNAGLVLNGAEVKSVKAGNVSLAGAYVGISANGANLINCHIGPYKYAPNEKYNPTQTRKLLLNKGEINQMLGKEKGLTIIPLEIYLGHRGLIKIKIGLGKQERRLINENTLKNGMLKKR